MPPTPPPLPEWWVKISRITSDLESALIDFATDADEDDWDGWVAECMNEAWSAALKVVPPERPADD
jgi:hypothetical protein